MASINEKLHTKEALQLFADRVISKAKANLKSGSGRLSKSLFEKLEVFPNSFSLKFHAIDYADFIDQGVKGAVSTYPESRGSDYSYKKHPNPYKKGANVVPPASKFDKWNIFRGRAGRDEKGRFLTRKSLNFATAIGIYQKGIKAQRFFTKAFNEEFKTLPPKLEEAIGKDAEAFIETTFRDHLK